MTCYTYNIISHIYTGCIIHLIYNINVWLNDFYPFPYGFILYKGLYVQAAILFIYTKDIVHEFIAML